MDWFFLIFFVFFLVIAIQPALAQRQLRAMRRRVIVRLEKKLNARVITLIHRQERTSIFGFTSARYIDIDDANAVIHAIKTTPSDKPIALVLHTPGGLVLASMQIARAIKAHRAPVSVYVPIYAMSGGTLIALAADEIVMDRFATLGPVDPQIAGLPAPSIVNVKAEKPATHIHDLTMVLADIGEKAMRQLHGGVRELTQDRMGPEAASSLADALTSGVWTHDYAITVDEARQLGLPAHDDLPHEVSALMTLYPQPVQTADSVETAPADSTGRHTGGGVNHGIWRFWSR